MGVERRTGYAIWLGSNVASGRNAETKLTFAFRIDLMTFGGTAYCSAERCRLEADGGTFTLRPIGRHMQLTVGNHLSIEGANGFSPDLAERADDRVFRRHPAARDGCSALVF